MCEMWKQKASPIRCCDDAFLKKIFIEKCLCWSAHRKPYVPYETMLEKIDGSTSSSGNIHNIINDYSNHYRSIMMDEMRINLGY
jgi:hypothetical protein